MPDLDAADAKLHWDLSRYAYRDQPDAQQAVENRGLTWGRFFNSGGSTQGFTCSDGSRTILAFRGSEEDPIDWIKNAQFGPTPGELGGHVHSGHHGALSEVWDDVQRDVQSAGLPVSTTGHSLGAALAALAAARLSEANVTVDAVYTYGQPRTGKSDFQRAYDDRLGDKTFRFVNHIDLVTRVPLLFQGYRHVGRRMYFNEQGAFTPDAGTWAVARDDLTYRLGNFGKIQAIGIDPHLKPAYSATIGSL